ARDAEIGKLGPTGPARIDALARFFTSYLGEGEGKGVMARIFTASDVQNLEKLVQKVTSGSAAFTAGGREPPPASGRVSNEQFAKMSAAERLDYARKFDQSQFASRAN
ncbi:MAG TPA: hypothetical protein VMU08_08240, partial [Rhizomicrobium sp.]|nr:hypothetical protein [Rhizomicrobium sp.]